MMKSIIVLASYIPQEVVNGVVQPMRIGHIMLWWSENVRSRKAEYANSK